MDASLRASVDACDHHAAFAGDATRAGRCGATTSELVAIFGCAQRL